MSNRQPTSNMTQVSYYLQTAKAYVLLSHSLRDCPLSYTLYKGKALECLRQAKNMLKRRDNDMTETYEMDLVA